MIKVFHLNIDRDPNVWFTARNLAGAIPLWAGRATWYTEVAEVDCGLENAFDLTNHGAPDVPDEGWHLGDKIRKYMGNPRGTRSTSVGDVVVDESGQAWLCQPMGWGKL
jgi:hypothetical protein